MAEELLHDGPRYRVVYHRSSDSPDVVVCFEFWLPVPCSGEPLLAADFFIKRGINFVGIKPAANDWFQDDEILQALTAIRAATAGMRRIGYGGSMGAYAVVNYAEALDLATMLVICPQFSIDRGKVPFEPRWQQEAARISFRHDQIATIRPIRSGYAVFDPTDVDGQHFGLIARRHALTPIRIYFAGHEQLRFLNPAGLTEHLLLGVIEGNLDLADLIRRIRAARSHSGLMWLGVAATRLRRREYSRAMSAMKRARRGPLPDAFGADVLEAEIAVALGGRAEAARLLSRYENDPALAAVARWHASRLNLPTAVAAPAG